MLAFITPLPHPHNCDSYARISRLLRRTVDSIRGQDSEKFVLIVVGNRRPEGLPDDQRFEWLGVDLPPASSRPGRVLPEDTVRVFADKSAKLAAGLLAARQYSPTHVMFCDCDDLVHRGLASFSEKHAGEPGWYVDAGYVYWEGSGRLAPVRKFHLICGTSFVIAWHLLGVPGDVGPHDDAAEIRQAWDKKLFTGVLGRHQTKLGYFRGRGVEMAPLPFPGAIWVRGTGENVSRFGGFASITGKLVDGAIRRDFSFEAPVVSRWRDAARAVPQTISGIAPLIQKFGAAWFLRHYVLAMPRRVVDTIRGKPWGS